MSEFYDPFARAKALPDEMGASFPRSQEEVAGWAPHITFRAISTKVIVVATTRVECAWTAYCDAVPGKSHRREFQRVLSHGSKLDEQTARALFPQFAAVEYAR